MGEHDNAALWHTHAGDTHDDIHDDGRTLDHPEFAPGAGAGAGDEAYGDTLVYRYSHDKLIPDTVHIRSRSLHVTEWESLYSTLYGTGTQANYDFPVLEKVNPSFVPIIDENYRVVGHLGWIDGYEICVPMDTIQVGAKLGATLEKRRLGEMRQPFLADADRFARPPFANSPFHAATTWSPSAPKPDNCIPPAKTSLRSTNWDDARRGPLKGESDELRYQRNINYFLAGGGNAVVGRKFGYDLLAGEKYESFLELKGSQEDEDFWDVLAPREYFSSSGYRFLVLVRPDGYLQGVLGVAKVSPETRNERQLRIAFGIIDFALTFLMTIDLVYIPVALVHVASYVAERIEIRAIELAIDRAAKISLKTAELEAKGVLVRGAMSGPERAEAKTAWAKLKQKFWDAGNVQPSRRFTEDQAKEWNSKIAKRMSELGIPKKNQGAGLRHIPPSGEKPPPGGGKKRPFRDENGKAFNELGSARGGNYRSSPIDEYGGYELGVSVHGNVFDRWEGFDLWNHPSTTVEDRIDATIAHEWSEFNGLTHWETVELIPETKLPISQRARELSRYMMMMAGEPEMAFTEFTKAEWSAIKAAGKQNAPFEEKMAAAAAAKAK